MSRFFALRLWWLAVAACLLLPGPASAGDVVLIAAPRTVGVGKPFLVRISSRYPLADIVVRWNGETVRPTVTWRDGQAVADVLLGVGLRQPTGTYVMEILAPLWGHARSFTRTVEVVESAWGRETLRVPPKMVRPPLEAQARIARERRLALAAIREVSPQRYWRTPFARPAQGVMLSRFGLYRVFNGHTKSRHTGLDFRAWLGTPLFAMADGRVVLTGGFYYAGNVVFIDHGNGLVSMACHMSRILVAQGDTVAAGQVIGLSGATGRVNGAHLHLATFVLGRSVDPELFFTGDIESYFNENSVILNDNRTLEPIKSGTAPLWRRQLETGLLPR